MEKSLHQMLEDVGLTEKESVLYLTCLQYGKVTASTLSRMTGIARASIYDHMDRLLAKWFIKTWKDSGKSYYSAVDPQNIYVFLNEKKNTIEKQIRTFRDSLDLFDKLKEFTGIVPQVQYYEWREALEFFFKQIAAAKYSYSIFSLDNLLKHVYFDIDEILANMSNPTIKGAKRIMAYSPKALEYLKKQVNPNIERKLLPKGYEMEAEITLYDGVLLQMSFGEKPSILEIKHPIFYKAHKTIFEYLRNSLGKVG